MRFRSATRAPAAGEIELICFAACETTMKTWQVRSNAVQKELNHFEDPQEDLYAYHMDPRQMNKDPRLAWFEKE
jgi:hypothetical protein